VADRTFLRPGIARASRPRRLSLVLWLGFAAAAGLGTFRYLSGPALAISRFEIEGTRRCRTQELFDALAPFRGRNLVVLNLAPVSARLERVAWVARVTVTKEFPDTLRITIAEKTPIALRRDGGELFWLDGDGGVIAPFDARVEAADLPVVTAPNERLSQAAALLRNLQSAVPAYESALSELWALPSSGFGMMDSIFRVPIDVMPGDAADKIRSLLSLREELEARGLTPRGIDLRFDRRIVLSGVFGEGRRI
jgi:cell division septal protein FtsQ